MRKHTSAASVAFGLLTPKEDTPLHAHLEDPKGQRPCYRNQYDFQDRQGALWLGTFNRGLLYYHPALYKHIHIDKKDFPLSLERNTAVANFTEDRDGNIFIKDRTAIYKLDLQEDGNRILIPVEASTLPKELQGEYGSEAAFVSHDGTLYFGDADGCNIFSPNPEPPSSSLPYPPVSRQSMCMENASSRAEAMKTGLYYPKPLLM